MIALVALLMNPAAAEDHYSTAGIAENSEQFTRIAQATQTQFDQMQRQIAIQADALNKWEKNLGLLGDRAPVEEVALFGDMSKQFGSSKRAAEVYLGGLADETSDVFSAALERALQGVDAIECDAGPSGPRMTRGTQEKVECPGTSLSEQIAKTIDADPILAGQVDELMKREGPAVAMPMAPAQPVGEGARVVVDLYDLMSAYTPTPMQAVAEGEDFAWLKLEAKLEGDVDEAQLAALKQEREQIRLSSAAAYAELAAPVMAAIEDDAKKWARAGRPAVGFCPRPAALEGCSVPMATDALMAEIAEQTKTRRALMKVEKTGVDMITD